MTYATGGITFGLLVIALSMLVCLIWLTSSVLQRAYPTYSIKLGYPLFLGLLGFILGLTSPNFPSILPVFKGIVLSLACTVAGFYAGRKLKQDS